MMNAKGSGQGRKLPRAEREANRAARRLEKRVKAQAAKAQPRPGASA